jgi:hypothetical protein
MDKWIRNIIRTPRGDSGDEKRRDPLRVPSFFIYFLGSYKSDYFFSIYFRNFNKEKERHISGKVELWQGPHFFCILP